MLDIILAVVVVLTASGAYLYRSRMKQRLLNELAYCYDEGTNLLKTYTGEKLPTELKKALHHPLRELSISLRSLEESVNSELAIFRMKEILKEDKPLVETNCKEIQELCSRWNSYATFKHNLNEGLSEVCSHSYDLTEKMQAITRYDLKSQEIVQIRAAGVLSQLDDYQTKYREISSLSFEDYSIEHTLPVLTKEFLNEVEYLSRELQYFNRSLKVMITGLFRKSIYYINLEDNTEKSFRRHAGTIPVSYKTYRDTKKGDSYKWEIVIGGKYTTGEQNITFKLFKGDQQSTITNKLTKSQFEEIFKALKFNRKFEETDDEGIPYQINALDLNFVVCEKKAYEFDVIYHVDLFKSTSIYDFNSYNDSDLELALENKSQPPLAENSTENPPAVDSSST